MRRSQRDTAPASAKAFTISSEQVTTGLFRNRTVAGRRPREYLHVSVVEAELCLLRAAMDDDRNQFFLLHSESCIPLCTFSQACGAIR